MNLTNPTRILTRILTLRANPTRLKPILDPEGPTRPENGLGFKSSLLSTL